MVEIWKAVFFACTLGAGLASCGGAGNPPAGPATTRAPASASPGASADAARPSLTAEACEASGGALIGDIGDGAIHRPEYRCPNGAKPSANIAAEQGRPIAVEGSVCCPR